MEMLDLSASVPVETFVLEIMYPGTSKPTGWQIELAGPQHPQTIAASNEFARELIEKEKAVEFAQVNGRKYKTEDETVESRRRKNVARVCRRIIGWTPNPTFKSVQPDPVTFSVESATSLFVRPDMAGFFVQITDYVNGERAFMPPSDQV